MEEWKDCVGYEDCYEISNQGKVRSKDRQSISYGTRMCDRKGRERKSYCGKNGYMYVDLCKEGNRKTWNVHKLVAMTFISNPLGLPQVDHIDRNKTNNNVSNLRWVSNAENQANRGMPKNNTSGEMYVTVHYRVCVIRDGKKIQKSFNNIEDAKEFRKTIVGF